MFFKFKRKLIAAIALSILQLESKVRAQGCVVAGHEYEKTVTVCRGIYELQCQRCKAEFGMHEGLQMMLPLDDGLRREHKKVMGNG